MPYKRQRQTLWKLALYSHERFIETSVAERRIEIIANFSAVGMAVTSSYISCFVRKTPRRTATSRWAYWKPLHWQHTTQHLRTGLVYFNNRLHECRQTSDRAHLDEKQQTKQRWIDTSGRVGLIENTASPLISLLIPPFWRLPPQLVSHLVRVRPPDSSEQVNTRYSIKN